MTIRRFAERPSSSAARRGVARCLASLLALAGLLVAPLGFAKGKTPAAAPARGGECRKWVSDAVVATLPILEGRRPAQHFFMSRQGFHGFLPFLTPYLLKPGVAAEEKALSARSQALEGEPIPELRSCELPPGVGFRSGSGPLAKDESLVSVSAFLDDDFPGLGHVTGAFVSYSRSSGESDLFFVPFERSDRTLAPQKPIEIAQD